MFRVVSLVLFSLVSSGLTYCSPFSNTFSVPVTNDIKIVDITPQKFSVRDFKRIKEYFNGGREYYGHKCIVRDDPANRGGLYFIVNFNKPLTELPSNIKVNIYLIFKEKLEAEKFSFKLPNKRPSFTAEAYLGITSRNLSKSDINAWKIELIGANGDQLALYKSYMWPKEM